MMIEISAGVVNALSFIMFSLVGLICVALGVHTLKTPEADAKI